MDSERDREQIARHDTWSLVSKGIGVQVLTAGIKRTKVTRKWEARDMDDLEMHAKM